MSSSKKVRAELHEMLNSLQIQIVKTSSYLQVLVDQYDELHALSVKMQEESLAKKENPPTIACYTAPQQTILPDVTFYTKKECTSLPDVV